MIKKIAKVGFWGVMGGITIAASYIVGAKLGLAVAEAFIPTDTDE